MSLPRIMLEPFENCAAIIVPLPPVYAALCSVHRVRCLHFPIHPDGYVPFAVFIDREDRDDEQIAAWCGEYKTELLAEARRLAATPIIFN